MGLWRTLCGLALVRAVDDDDFLITAANYPQGTVKAWPGPIHVTSDNLPFDREVEHLYRLLRAKAKVICKEANGICGLEIEVDPFTGVWTAKGALAVIG
jgi:hypothetical protein